MWNSVLNHLHDNKSGLHALCQILEWNSCSWLVFDTVVIVAFVSFSYSVWIIKKTMSGQTPFSFNNPRPICINSAYSKGSAGHFRLPSLLCESSMSLLLANYSKNFSGKFFKKLSCVFVQGFVFIHNLCLYMYTWLMVLFYHSTAFSQLWNKRKWMN